MKKFILLLFALLLVQGIYALPVLFNETLNLESFRHQATASIEDDLDNGIDGTDIFKVEGAHLFTNLSNLVNAKETQADNSNSAQTLLIGAISPIYKGWKAALFYGNANYQGSHTGSETAVNLWDDDIDNPFDWRSVLKTDTSANITDNDNCILVNIGRVMGEETELAFTYKRTCSKVTSDFTNSAIDSVRDLDAGVTTGYEESNGNGDADSSAPVSLYSLSYAKPFKDWKLRGDVFLYMGGEKDNLNRMYRSFIDNSPSDISLLDDNLDSSIVANQDDYSANLAGVSLRLGDVNEYGLWEVGGNIGMVIGGSGDYKASERSHSIEHDQTGSDIEVTNITTNNEASGPISVSGMNMGLNGRTEWQISPNVRWGIGLIVNRFSTTLEYDIDDFETSRTVYNDGDPTPEPTDYITTGIGGSSYLRTIEIKTNSFIVPTGIEISIGKKKDWLIRLGALAIGSTTENTNSIDFDEASIQPDSVTTVYGDGSSTTTVVPSAFYTDSKYTNTTTYQGVDFVYGLGWKPSPNLSLDLVGMFDAPFGSPIIISADPSSSVDLLSTGWFKSLRLSATINIY